MAERLHSNRIRLWMVMLAGSLAAATAAIADEPKAGQAAVETMNGKAAGDVRDDNGLKMSFVWCPRGFVTMEMGGAPVEIRAIDEPAVELQLFNKLQEAHAAAKKHDKDDFEPMVEVVEEEIEFAPILPAAKMMKPIPVKAFVTKGYWLGKCEVTQSEWTQVMKTKPWKHQESTKEGPDYPATYLDWNDAVEFCRKLTELERAAKRLPDDWEYTLPTEAQWERACRAGTVTRFSFGDDERRIDDYGWVLENTTQANEDYPHQVGEKKSNPWGLHDMHGNVWEWCRDSYSAKLPGGRDPEVTQKSAERVLRGGGIYRNASECHSAYRNKHVVEWKLFDLGLRVALCQVKTKVTSDE